MKRVDPELVEILVCPDTKLNVDLVPTETVDKINLARLILSTVSVGTRSTLSLVSGQTRISTSSGSTLFIVVHSRSGRKLNCDIQEHP